MAAKILSLSKVRKEERPATSVERLLVDAADMNFCKAIIVAQDAEGYWYFQCTEGIDKVSTMGMIEMLKMDLFDSMRLKD